MLGPMATSTPSVSCGMNVWQLLQTQCAQHIHTFMGCTNGKCAPVLATCINNCSGTQGGVCSYVRAETDTPIEACYTGDSTCEAICECQTGRHGEDCSLSESQMAQEIRLYRTVLCGNKASGLQSSDTNRMRLHRWSNHLWREEEENTSEHNEDAEAEAEMEVRITVHEERPAAAEVDTRALDIIQHVRDMVNAHVREVGEMSDSDDEEKETPRYRLAEVLHRPGMMEKLFDLSSDENDDHEVNIAVREGIDLSKLSSRKSFDQPRRIHNRSASTVSINFQGSSKSGEYNDDLGRYDAATAEESRVADLVGYMRELLEQSSSDSDIGTRPT
jgi:hypothetical protein